VSTRISRVRKVSDPSVAALSSGSVGRRTTHPPASSPATAHAALRAYYYLALTTGHCPPSPLPFLVSPWESSGGGCERAQNLVVFAKISPFRVRLSPGRNFPANGEVFLTLAFDTCSFAHFCFNETLKRCSTNYTVQGKRKNHFRICFNLNN